MQNFMVIQVLSPWSIFYQPYYIVLLRPFYHLCFLNIGNKV